ncbi:MAG: HAD family hydrolase [Candidatus Nanohaloarchaea archaeon]
MTGSFDAVIFDNDGTILDSSYNEYRWVQQAKIRKAEELGFSLTPEEAKNYIFSDSIHETRSFLEGKGMDWNDLRAIIRNVSEKKKQLMAEGKIRPFNSAEKLLEQLSLPKAMVSNASRESTEQSLDEFNLRNSFETVHAPSLNNMKRRARIRKPSPDMLEEAMEQLGTRNVLMVGDSDADILAAENAGIESALIKRRKVEAEPDYSIDSLIELKQILA